MAPFHPDLRIARFIPPLNFTARTTALINKATPRVPPTPVDMVIETLRVPGPEGAPDVSVRFYRPRALRQPAPALFWIHGGGMITGSALQDERSCVDFARTLGITVASVDYRLAPEHPAPAALEDCYAALRWLFDHASERDIDPTRIAIGGASAGGGLAAGVALMAHDRGEVDVAFQLLVYPMIDDRTVLRTDHDLPEVRVWTKKSNLYGWTSYVGTPGGAEVSDYAAPARRGDLGGLPPAWIGVGSFDLFHDEDIAYAQRLRDAGVPCEVTVIQGAFHGFDAVFPGKPVSKAFWRTQADALQKALFPA
ncbi:alpha/beta hydrolase [Microbacterium sp. C7(2022)]|uniref:alpha/beta hydrolase n=1 Tax=Microbacterium sp. C7(2022) TaxID=2992759 RepID=UPI00237A293B|nr:alpha/beta hydrolase [Microbacterium sp. C7(2022)]